MRKRNFLFVLAFMPIFTGCTNDASDPGKDGDPVGTVYFEEHFDKMVWGGDYVADEPGLRAIYIRNENDMAIIDESQPPEECTVGRDGSGDFYYHMAESYLIDRGVADWDGNKVYERPGYIKVGTGSTRSGYVVTPPFEAISEEPVNVEVVLNIARWSSASNQVFIEILGGGTASVDFVEAPEHSSWEEAKFTINAATPETRVRFVTDPRDDGRFFLDDLVVSKVE